MATGKKSFVLYCDLIHTVKKLTDEQAGNLFKHILKYVNDENPEADNIITEITFEPIKQQFKRDLIAWEQVKEKRAEAGRASAEARKLLKDVEQNQQVLTSVESVEQNPTKSTVNVNDNVNVNVNDNVIIKEEVKSDKPITHTSKFIIPTIDEIKEYCLERNNRVDATKFYNFYESKGWLIGKNKMKDWKAAVRNWEASDNKSLKPAAYNNEREIKQF